MPYYVFNNFVSFLNEIIEEENSGSKDSANASEHLTDAQNTFKNQMGSTMKEFQKSAFKGLKR